MATPGIQESRDAVRRVPLRALRWARENLRRTALRRSPIGAPPGVVSPDPDAEPTRIRLMAFGPDHLDEREVASVDDLPIGDKGDSTLWIDVVGLGDADVIRAIGAALGLHPLALEDVAHVHQRPKVDVYDDQLYIVTRIVRFAEHLDVEQVSLFLGPGWVLTFQEREGDCFEPVRARIRSGRTRIRTQGADYLTYALLDAVADHFFPVLEVFGDRLEALEDRIVEGETGQTLMADLLKIRHELVALRRVVWPMREATNALLREDLPHIDSETRLFLRDCYDHILRAIDLTENFRELGSGLLEVHLAVAGQKLNEVMKVLTIIATIFIPLGFIAGLYGMNFNPERSPYNMPELNWALGYPFALSLMAALTVGMLVYFRRKGWL